MAIPTPERDAFEILLVYAERVIAESIGSPAKSIGEAEEEDEQPDHRSPHLSFGRILS